MNTVFRAYGLRFVIFTADHEPPHVHVYGRGQVMRIAIKGRDGLPYVISNSGMKFGETRRALDTVEENADVLLRFWERLHG